MRDVFKAWVTQAQDQALLLYWDKLASGCDAVACLVLPDGVICNQSFSLLKEAQSLKRLHASARQLSAVAGVVVTKAFLADHRLPEQDLLPHNDALMMVTSDSFGTVVTIELVDLSSRPPCCYPSGVTYQDRDHRYFKGVFTTTGSGL